MPTQSWLFYALLAAFTAALVPIFAKIGMKGIDSTITTAIRSVVMMVVVLSACGWSRLWSGIGTIGGKAFWMILLSGAAGAASWLFYFKAIQVGGVAMVAPIDKLSMPLAVILAFVRLRERPTTLNWTGVALMVIGALLAAREAHA